MIAAAALRNKTVFDQQTPSPSRGETLARYRRLREIGKRHHDNVLGFLAKDAILDHARRLGLAVGKTLVLDSMAELTLAIDLAIHTAPPGRSRAIDRYANSARLAPGTEEAVMLEAMRDARFAILLAQSRHSSAGLIVTDLFREIDLWLVDEGLEISLPDGAAFATRYFAPGPFVMTAGVGVPIGREALTRAIESAPQLMRKPHVDAIQDRRFAEAVYRGAIEDGMTEKVQYRDPIGDGDEA
ncbi:MAG: hypothetical protein ABR878_11465 [Roseiarcus sp.]|jgi:hypothetical protein